MIIHGTMVPSGGNVKKHIFPKQWHLSKCEKGGNGHYWPSIISIMIQNGQYIIYFYWHTIYTNFQFLPLFKLYHNIN